MDHELDLDSSDFEKIGETFDTSANQIYQRKGKIGEADTILLNQQKFVDFAVCWMEEYRK